MNLTHRNRFSRFGAYLAKTRSAAVPPLQRRGLEVRQTCSIIRKRFQYIFILYYIPKKTAK